MRIRRKKHLEERVAILSDYLLVLDESIKNVNEAIKVKNFIDTKAIFNNENPVELEIGCGKGGFVCEKARQNPQINYIAVEMLQNIIVMSAELAKSNNLRNVIFLNSGAEYLPRYIKPQSINTIYLNFSPPYPKDGYENRRLTSERFVKFYREFLKEGGKIIQKTDDKDFFEYSKSIFSKNGFIVLDLTNEYNDGKILSVKTEYELKFNEIGIKTNYLEAILVKND